MKVEADTVGNDPTIYGPYDSGADQSDSATCVGSSGETTSQRGAGRCSWLWVFMDFGLNSDYKPVSRLLFLVFLY